MPRLFFSFVVLGVPNLAVCMETAGGQEDPKTLREQVLKARTPRGAAKAYRALFETVGKAGLADLTKDEDAGIALHASWEVRKKAVKRPEQIRGRTDDIYDPDELKKFLDFLKDRTKAPIPDWWAKGIVSVDLFPQRHHAFSGSREGISPKRRVAKSGHVVPDGAELEVSGDNLIYSTGGRKVEFPKTTFDTVVLGECFAGVIGEKRAAIAAYFSAGGGGFLIAGFEGAGGKPTWTANVWAAQRMEGGNADHRVEVVQKGDTVYVFGGESHGMYLEAFDITSGKCQFRFCSCYWFNFSETWKWN